MRRKLFKNENDRKGLSMESNERFMKNMMKTKKKQISRNFAQTKLNTTNMRLITLIIKLAL